MKIHCTYSISDFGCKMAKTFSCLAFEVATGVGYLGGYAAPVAAIGMLLGHSDNPVRVSACVFEW